MAKDLLFEIGTEEIPAKFLPGIINELEKIASEQLATALITFKNIDVYATPRRLSLLVWEMLEVQTEKTVENKGPAIKIAYMEDGSLSKAALGFARGQGVAAQSLKERDGYLYAEKTMGGQAVAKFLPEILNNILNSLVFPKSMRWSDLDFRFVRPIHWFVALFGDEMIPFESARVVAGKHSYGHRFLSDGSIEIKNAAHYKQVMKDNFVIVDQDERRIEIKKQIKAVAEQLGGQIAIDEELLEEVVHLVEYPTALSGRFDEEFLQLPKEAVVTPMREHQRYFPVLSSDGRLLPYFITVRNGDSHNLSIVAQGNERVLRARLSDAAFFFNEDKKQTLESRLEKLKTVVFQEGLGSIYDKSQRLRALAAYISETTCFKDIVDMEKLDRAAQLCKADLVTGMVGEFAELQGVMGREYALLDGEDKLVAEGIFEHYLPRFAGDILPQTYTGRLVGLADKIDNITATFSRGLIPTGSQDPYALRRQAIGIINMLQESGYSLSLSAILAKSMELLNVEAGSREKITMQIMEFFLLRVKNILTNEGIRYDLVDAVLAVGIDDIAQVFARARAMAAFAQDGEKMLLATQALTRVINISKQPLTEIKVEEKLFADIAEKELYKELRDLQGKAELFFQNREYQEALDCVAQLAQPINAFFDSVMVMVEDEQVKNNRLSLLKEIAAFSLSVADLSCIVE